MFEAILAGLVLGIGMVIWNKKIEPIFVNTIIKHFAKNRDENKTIFIDPK